MTGRNTCAMSIDCEGKEADHGLMCRDHRAEDAVIYRDATPEPDCIATPIAEDKP